MTAENPKGYPTTAAIRGQIGVHLLRPDTQIIERPGWYQVITPSSRHAFLNDVVLSDHREGETDRVIQEVIAQYARHGVPFKWLVGPWSEPTDLGERLACLGFRPVAIRGMVCDPKGIDVEIDSSSVVEPVDGQNIDEYVAVYLAGWNFSDIERAATRRSLVEALADPLGRRGCFLARVEGRPAGTASQVVKPDEGTAYLTGGNVLPEFRGRGIYRALIATRLAILRERGISLATTQAHEATSAPILEKLGFETVFHAHVYLSPH